MEAPGPPIPSEETAARLRAYATAVADIFASQFRQARDRFGGWERLLDNFATAVKSVLQHGARRFSDVNSAHNELCIAGAVLGDTAVQRLEYEPRLAGTLKSIDFRAERLRTTVFIDVKTIQPESNDRWSQYERAKEEEFFPENVRFGVEKEWLGGEIWHSAYASRGRMLEYALELEQKIAEARITDAVCILAFCGNGFDWHQDELEDFVSFYRGRHRADDPFAKMERVHVDLRKIELQRTISAFAFMSRSDHLMHPDRLIWDVRAPADGF